MNSTLASFEGFIFDLDGVIYRGEQPIDGAKECIEMLKAKSKKYVFATNHTTHTKQEFIDKLTNMGIPLTENNIVTAGEATVDYLKKHTTQNEVRVNLIAAGGINKEFEDAGFLQTTENPEFVVVAWDSGFNYEKIFTACKNIREGAVFVVTGPTRYIPSERGSELGPGTLGAPITYATKVDPIYVSKPYQPMILTACNMMHVPPENTIIVGDTPESDLRSKSISNLGASALVLSGNTSKEQIEGLPEDQKPTFVFDSVKELAQNL